MSSLFKPAIQRLPELPGVYLMQDVSDRVLYVGKAINLKKRVASYWSIKSGSLPKIEALVNKIEKLDFIVTDNEVEALILENELIKKHRPPFNVLLRDDKTYQYIRIDLDEKFPVITAVRRVSVKDLKRKKSKVRYFGPYVSGGSVKNTFKLINSIFPICAKAHQLNRASGQIKSPCLNWHLKKCPGACMGEISSADYKKIIDQIIKFLLGDYKVAFDFLNDKMEKSVKSRKFEDAAKLRDQIKSLDLFFQKQKVSLADSLKSNDFLGMILDGSKMIVARLIVRSGRLLDQQIFVMEAPNSLAKEELTSKAIKLIYDSVFENVPKSIFVEDAPNDNKVLQAWLARTWNKSIKIKSPQKGINKKMLLMAKKNAISHSGSLLNLDTRLNINKAIKALARNLGLKRKITRMEAYDISHLGGTYTVGSMVVFENGLPKKSEYRRFRIKTVMGVDDYGALSEMISRRLHSSKRNNKQFVINLPQIILIDGGRGQLNSVVKNISKINLRNIKFISLAKREELVFTLNNKQPLCLKKDSPALMLLQRLRDEAHRFALSYQVSLRTKQIKSTLEDIPGIGVSTRRKLIKVFGSLAVIKKVDEKKISKLIGDKKAKIVKEFL